VNQHSKIEETAFSVEVASRLRIVLDLREPQELTVGRIIYINKNVNVRSKA
jgi:hypothetical protein